MNKPEINFMGKEVNKRYKELLNIGTDLLIENIKSEIYDRFMLDVDYKNENCTTPIEDYFMIGLINCIHSNDFFSDMVYFNRFLDGRNQSDMSKIPSIISEVENNTCGVLLIITQYKIEQYTTDFCLIYLFYNSQFEQMDQIKVIVECDGHNFHEKTKQQAQHDKKRDRLFQKLGYSVFHYTGSELYADPFTCAKEVYSFVFDKYNQIYKDSKKIMKGLLK